MTAMTAANESALRAKFAALPTLAISSPPAAGPMVRARLELTPLSTAASAISSRGTSSGWMARKIGSDIELPTASSAVSAMRSEGVTAPIRGHKGERRGCSHSDRLTDDQQPPTVDDVAKSAGRDDEQEHGQRARSLDEGHLERGTAEVAHRPLRTDGLRVRSEVPDELRDPQGTKDAMAKRRPRPTRLLLGGLRSILHRPHYTPRRSGPLSAGLTHRGCTSLDRRVMVCTPSRVARTAVSCATVQRRTNLGVLWERDAG